MERGHFIPTPATNSYSSDQRKIQRPPMIIMVPYVYLKNLFCVLLGEVDKTGFLFLRQAQYCKGNTRILLRIENEVVFVFCYHPFPLAGQ